MKNIELPIAITFNNIKVINVNYQNTEFDFKLSKTIYNIIEYRLFSEIINNNFNDISLIRLDFELNNIL